MISDVSIIRLQHPTSILQQIKNLYSHAKVDRLQHGLLKLPSANFESLGL